MIRYSEVRLDAGSIKELPDGSIRVTGQLTRPGIFTYRNPDGTERREYRPREEVFSPRTKETFASTTVTMNHPSRGVGQRKVSPDTWQKDAVGHMGETIRQDGDYLVGDLFIREAKAVAGVKSGEVKFVSLGYDVDYDPTPGTDPEGGRYDGVQRKIVGNHVALLPQGIAPRGGEGCSLRLDAAGDEEPFRTDDVVGASAPALDCGRAMPEPINPALVAAEAQITALKGELDKSRADAVDVTSLKAKVTELTAENAKLLAQLTPERLDALASERAALVAVAKDAGIAPEGKTSLQLKRAVVAKKTPALASRVDSMDDNGLDPVLAVYASLPHPTMVAVVAPAAGAPLPAATSTDATRTDAIKPIWEIREAALAKQHLRFNDPSDLPGVHAAVKV